MLFRNFAIARRMGKLSRKISATDISVNFPAVWEGAEPSVSTRSTSSQSVAIRVSDSPNEMIGRLPESMLDCTDSSRIVPQTRLRSSALSRLILGSLLGSRCRPFSIFVLDFGHTMIWLGNSRALWLDPTGVKRGEAIYHINCGLYNFAHRDTDEVTADWGRLPS